MSEQLLRKEETEDIYRQQGARPKDGRMQFLSRDSSDLNLGRRQTNSGRERRNATSSKGNVNKIRRIESDEHCNLSAQRKSASFHEQESGYSKKQSGNKAMDLRSSGEKYKHPYYIHLQKSKSYTSLPAESSKKIRSNKEVDVENNSRSGRSNYRRRRGNPCQKISSVSNEPNDNLLNGEKQIIDQSAEKPSSSKSPGQKFKDGKEKCLQTKLFVTVTEKFAKKSTVQAYIRKRTSEIPYVNAEWMEAAEGSLDHSTICILYESKAKAMKAMNNIKKSNKISDTKLVAFLDENTPLSTIRKEFSWTGNRDENIRDIREIEEQANKALHAHEQMISSVLNKFKMVKGQLKADNIAKENLTRDGQDGGSRKKNTKKKTKWRTLPLNDDALDEEMNKIKAKIDDREKEIHAIESKLEELNNQKEEFKSYVRRIKQNLSKVSELHLYRTKSQRLRKEFGIECCRLKQALPIYARRKDILKIVSGSQVSIILGETGSGKSTQMTQYLYEAGFAEKGIIACTQPRKIAALSLASHVAVELASSVGDIVGYKVGMKEKSNRKTKILYTTDHALLQECLKDKVLRKFSCIIVDEAHERSLYTDLLLGMIQACLKTRKDLKVVVTSATIQPKVFQQYFGGCPMLQVSGRLFPVDIKYCPPERESQDIMDIYEQLAIDKAVEIHQKQEEGDILVFFSSPLETERACEKFRNKLSNRHDYECQMLHGKVQRDDQEKVFMQLRPGVRKIVFATNCAETSVTIPGIRYVIDTGMVKEMQYDEKRNMNCLALRLTNQSSAQQRSGRAGRTRPGVCYRMYKESDFQKMNPTLVPEILRVHLGNALLKLLELGVDPLEFNFVEAPTPHAMQEAMDTLVDLGAVQNKKITKLGKWLAKIPLEPRLSFLIWNAYKAGFTFEGVVIAALSSSGNSLFFRVGTAEDKNVSDLQKSKFICQKGDLLTMLRVYREWDRQPEVKKGRWCSDNSINGKIIKGARETVNEIVGILRKEHEATLKHTFAPEQEADIELQKVIFTSFKTNLCFYLGQASAGYLCLRQGQRVHLHPSCCHVALNDPPKWIVFDQITKTTKEYITNATEIPEEFVPDEIVFGSKVITKEKLQQLAVKSLHKLYVGSQVFREIVGPRFVKLKSLEHSVYYEVWGKDKASDFKFVDSEIGLCRTMSLCNDTVAKMSHEEDQITDAEGSKVATTRCKSKNHTTVGTSYETDSDSGEECPAGYTRLPNNQIRSDNCSQSETNDCAESEDQSRLANRDSEKTLLHRDNTTVETSETDADSDEECPAGYTRLPNNQIRRDNCSQSETNDCAESEDESRLANRGLEKTLLRHDNTTVRTSYETDSDSDEECTAGYTRLPNNQRSDNCSQSETNDCAESEDQSRLANTCSEKTLLCHDSFNSEGRGESLGDETCTIPVRDEDDNLPKADKSSLTSIEVKGTFAQFSRRDEFEETNHLDLLTSCSGKLHEEVSLSPTTLLSCGNSNTEGLKESTFQFSQELSEKQNESIEKKGQINEDTCQNEGIPDTNEQSESQSESSPDVIETQIFINKKYSKALALNYKDFILSKGNGKVNLDVRGNISAMMHATPAGNPDCANYPNSALNADENGVETSSKRSFGEITKDEAGTAKLNEENGTSPQVPNGAEQYEWNSGRKFVGTLKFPNVQFLDTELVIIDAQRETGAIQIFSSHDPDRKRILTFVDDLTKNILQQLKEEVCTRFVGDKDDNLRVDIGDGGLAKEILLPTDYREIVVFASKKYLDEDMDDTREAENLLLGDLMDIFSAHGHIDNINMRGTQLKDGRFIFAEIKFATTKAARDAVHAEKTPDNDSDVQALPKKPPPRRNCNGGVRQMDAKIVWVRCLRRAPVCCLFQNQIHFERALEKGWIKIDGDNIRIIPSGKKRMEATLDFTGKKTVADEKQIEQALLDIVLEATDFQDSTEINIENLLSVQVPRTNRFTATDVMLNDLRNNLEWEIRTEFGIKGQMTMKFLSDSKDDIYYEAELDVEENDFHKLKSCKLRCGWCGSEVEVYVILKKYEIFVKKNVFEVCKTAIEEAIKRSNRGPSQIKQIRNGNSLIIVTSEQLSKEIAEIIKADVIESKVGMDLHQFTSASGRAKLRDISRETGSDTYLDSRTMRIVIAGPPTSRRLARESVEQYIQVTETNNLKEFPLRGDHYPPGLMKQLLNKFGIELEGLTAIDGVTFARLDFRQQRLKIQGTEEAFTAVEQQIESLAEHIQSTLNRQSKELLQSDPNNCVVCFTPVDISDLYRMEYCGHAYCKFCFKEQLVHAVKNTHFPLSCANCNQNWVWKDIANSALYGHCALGEVAAATFRHHISQNTSEYHSCITADCGMVYRVTEQSQKYECPSCSVVICTSCHTAYHKKMSCEKATMARGRVDEGLAAWQRQDPDNRKLCPKCSVGIEKNRGCNHVYCTKCRTHICWVCLKIFPSTRVCYDHLSRAHGGLGIEDDVGGVGIEGLSSSDSDDELLVDELDVLRRRRLNRLLNRQRNQRNLLLWP